MSNHSFVTTHKWLTAERVRKDLEEIINRRFKSKVTLYQEEDYFRVGFEYPWQLEFWLVNCHKVEFRNPSPNWVWWVMAVVQNELAIKYNGLISDEGVEEKWKGTPDQYPTFKSYLKARYKGLPKLLKAAYAIMRAVDGGDMPKEVKGILS